MAEDAAGRARLGEYVTAARRAHYGTVEKAIRAAGINRATWLRVESGEHVRDDSLVAVERALGWEQGDAWRIAAGLEPMSQGSAQPPVTPGFSALRAHIDNSPELPGYAKRAILAILDAVEGGEENGDSNPGHMKGA